MDDSSFGNVIGFDNLFADSIVDGNWQEAQNKKPDWIQIQRSPTPKMTLRHGKLNRLRSRILFPPVVNVAWAVKRMRAMITCYIRSLAERTQVEKTSTKLGLDHAAS
jgi:hypothetical protein